MIRLLLTTNGLEGMPQATLSQGYDQLMSAARMGLRSWYSSLLATVPATEVHTEDLKGEIKEAWYSAQGALCVRLPERGARLTEVCLPEWGSAVRSFVAPGDVKAVNQLTPELRATPSCPVVILGGDVAIIYGIEPGVQAVDAGQAQGMDEAPGVGANPGARFKSLRMTAWPADGSYEFDVRHWPAELML